MKIGIFNTVRGGSQRFREACKRYQGELELVDFDFSASDENALKVGGCEAIIYTPWKMVTELFYKNLSKVGVKYILTCTAGYDHLDLRLIDKYDMRAANAAHYSPNAVAEHTVLSILALLRNYKAQIHRVEKNNYQIMGLMGKEIRSQTIGIIGAGRIGLTTMKCLSGFNPLKIYAYDLYQNDEVKQYAQYVSLEELYTKSDIIVFHCNLNKDNYRMVNSKSIEQMKDGVYLINVARGGLFDTKAVLQAVQAGKIGGLALDVLDEEQLLKGNTVFKECPVAELKELMSYENVIFTPHTAFFTKTAYEDMSRITIKNAYEYMCSGRCQYELIGE